MYQKTRQLVHLGKSLKSPQMVLKLQSPNAQKCQYKQQNNITSKDVLSSSHKLQAKKSPSKPKLYPNHMTTRQVSVLNVQNSFTQLNNSLVSVSNTQNSQYKQPFVQRTNLVLSPNHQQRKFVRVNFINSSQNGSRTSSSHLRQFKPSPAKYQKAPVQSYTSTNNRQLQSKIKILERRVGQLHQEKLQIVGQMNQQNRKIYHENTVLKLKITQLQKNITRLSQKQIKSQNQIIKSSKSLSSAHDLKIQQLTSQMNELESMLKKQYEKNGQLSQCIDQFQQNQKIYEQNVSVLMKQVQNYKSLLSQKQEQLQSYKENLYKYQISQQKASQKQVLQNQITQLKQTLTQTLSKNQQVFLQYQQKIQQYQKAYDNNQQIISQLTKQLEKQLQSNQNNKNMKLTNNQYVQSHKVIEQNQIQQFDCLQFQNNLSNAITERDNCLKQKDQQINTLKQHISLYQAQVNQKQQKIKELLTINNSLEGQLVKVNSAMNVYNNKIVELQGKYQQIYVKYEQQKDKSNKTDGFRQKCKKCDDLMRTIYRLNTHLNSKKAA